MLIDVHAHLDHEDFAADREEVLARARQAGVGRIIANGTRPETNRAVLDLASRYEMICPAVGIYPLDAVAAEITGGDPEYRPEPFDVDAELAFIEEVARAGRVCAIGEIGLDDYWYDGLLPAQEKVFERLLDIARETELPVIIHSRSAENRTVEILEAREQERVVLHAWGGKLKVARRACRRGFHLSIPPIAIRDQHFGRLARTLPIEQLLTETDSPYLGPVKEGRNEPCHVRKTVAFMATHREASEEEIEGQLEANARDLFGDRWLGGVGEER